MSHKIYDSWIVVEVHKWLGGVRFLSWWEYSKDCQTWWWKNARKSRDKKLLQSTQKELTQNIYDVLYIPDIFWNLLCVSQLLKKGYVLVFDDVECKMSIKRTFKPWQLLECHVTKFLLISCHKVTNLRWSVKKDNESQLCHLRYDHLNCQGHYLLQKKILYFLDYLEIEKTNNVC